MIHFANSDLFQVARRQHIAYQRKLSEIAHSSGH
jgi:hypothetical protein